MYASIVDRTVGSQTQLKPAGQAVVTVNAHLDRDWIEKSRSKPYDATVKLYYSLPPSLSVSDTRAYSLFEGDLCFTYNLFPRRNKTPQVLSLLNGVNPKDYDKIRLLGVAMSYIAYDGVDQTVPLDVALQVAGTTTIINSAPYHITNGQQLVYRLPTPDECRSGSCKLMVGTLDQEITRERAEPYAETIGMDLDAIRVIMLSRVFAKSLTSAAPGEPLHVLLY